VVVVPEGRGLLLVRVLEDGGARPPGDRVLADDALGAVRKVSKKEPPVK